MPEPSQPVFTPQTSDLLVPEPRQPIFTPSVPQTNIGVPTVGQPVFRPRKEFETVTFDGHPDLRGSKVDEKVEERNKPLHEQLEQFNLLNYIPQTDNYPSLKDQELLLLNKSYTDGDIDKDAYEELSDRITIEHSTKSEAEGYLGVNEPLAIEAMLDGNVLELSRVSDKGKKELEELLLSDIDKKSYGNYDIESLPKENVSEFLNQTGDNLDKYTETFLDSDYYNLVEKSSDLYETTENLKREIETVFGNLRASESFKNYEELSGSITTLQTDLAELRTSESVTNYFSSDNLISEYNRIALEIESKNKEVVLKKRQEYELFVKENSTEEDGVSMFNTEESFTKAEGLRKEYESIYSENISPLIGQLADIESSEEFKAIKNIDSGEISNYTAKVTEYMDKVSQAEKLYIELDNEQKAIYSSDPYKEYSSKLSEYSTMAEEIASYNEYDFYKEVFEKYEGNINDTILSSEFLSKVNNYRYAEFSGFGFLPEIKVTEDQKLKDLLQSEMYTNSPVTDKLLYLSDYYLKTQDTVETTKEEFLGTMNDYLYPQLDLMILKSMAKEKLGDLQKKYPDYVSELERNKKTALGTPSGLDDAYFSMQKDFVPDMGIWQMDKSISTLEAVLSMDYDKESSKWSRVKEGARSTDGTDWLPFIGSLASLSEDIEISKILTKFETYGVSGLTEPERALVETHAMFKAFSRATDWDFYRSLGTEVFPVMAQFIGEMALTAGVSGTVSQGTKSIIKSVPKMLGLKTPASLSKLSNIGLKGFSGLMGLTARTSVAGAPRIASETYRRMLPDTEVFFSPSYDKLILQIDKDSGDGLPKAFLKSYLAYFTEVSTESLGTFLSKHNAFSKLTGAIPFRSSDEIAAFATKLGMKPTTVEFISNAFSNNYVKNFLTRIMSHDLSRKTFGALKNPFVKLTNPENYSSAAVRGFFRSANIDHMGYEFFEEFLANRIHPIIEGHRDDFWRSPISTLYEETWQTAIAMSPLFGFGAVTSGTSGAVGGVTINKQKKKYNKLLDKIKNLSEEEFEQQSESIQTEIESLKFNRIRDVLVGLRERRIDVNFTEEGFKTFADYAAQFEDDMKVVESLWNKYNAEDSENKELVIGEFNSDEIITVEARGEFDFIRSIVEEYESSEELQEKFGTAQKYMADVVYRFQSIVERMYDYLEGGSLISIEEINRVVGELSPYLSEQKSYVLYELAENIKDRKEVQKRLFVEFDDSENIELGENNFTLRLNEGENLREYTLTRDVEGNVRFKETISEVEFLSDLQSTLDSFDLQTSKRFLSIISGMESISDNLKDSISASFFEKYNDTIANIEDLSTTNMFFDSLSILNSLNLPDEFLSKLNGEIIRVFSNTITKLGSENVRDIYRKYNSLLTLKNAVSSQTIEKIGRKIKAEVKSKKIDVPDESESEEETLFSEIGELDLTELELELSRDLDTALNPIADSGMYLLFLENIHKGFDSFWESLDNGSKALFVSEEHAVSSFNELKRKIDSLIKLSNAETLDNSQTTEKESFDILDFLKARGYVRGKRKKITDLDLIEIIENNSESDIELFHSLFLTWKSEYIKNSGADSNLLKNSELIGLTGSPRRKSFEAYRQDIEFVKKVLDNSEFRSELIKSKVKRKKAQKRYIRYMSDNVDFYNLLRQLVSVNPKSIKDIEDLKEYNKLLDSKKEHTDIDTFREKVKEYHSISQENKKSYVKKQPNELDGLAHELDTENTNFLRELIYDTVSERDIDTDEFLSLDVSDFSKQELLEYKKGLGYIYNNKLLDNDGHLANFIQKIGARRFMDSFVSEYSTAWVDALNKKANRLFLFDAFTPLGNLSKFNVEQILNFVDGFKHNHDGKLTRKIIAPLDLAYNKHRTAVEKIMSDFDVFANITKASSNTVGMFGLLNQRPDFKVNQAVLDYFTSIEVDTSNMGQGDIINLESEHQDAYAELTKKSNLAIAESILLSLNIVPAQIYELLGIENDINLTEKEIRSQLRKASVKSGRTLKDIKRENLEILKETGYNDMEYLVYDMMTGAYELTEDQNGYYSKIVKTFEDVKNGVHTDGVTLEAISKKYSGEDFVSIGNYFPIVRYKDFENIDETVLNEKSGNRDVDRSVYFNVHSDLNINNNFLAQRKHTVMALSINSYDILRSRLDQQLFYMMNEKSRLYLKNLLSHDFFNGNHSLGLNQESSQMIKTMLKNYFNRGISSGRASLRNHNTFRRINDVVNTFKVANLGFVGNAPAQLSSAVMGMQEMKGNVANRMSAFMWSTNELTSTAGTDKGDKYSEFLEKYAPEVAYRGISDFDLPAYKEKLSFKNLFSSLRDNTYKSDRSYAAELFSNRYLNGNIANQMQLLPLVFFDRAAARVSFFSLYKNYLDNTNQKFDFDNPDLVGVEFAVKGMRRTQNTDNPLYKPAVLQGAISGKILGRSLNPTGRSDSAAMHELLMRSYWSFKSFAVNEMATMGETRQKLVDAIFEGDMTEVANHAQSYLYNYTAKLAFYYLKLIGKIPMFMAASMIMYGSDWEEPTKELTNKYVDIQRSLALTFRDYRGFSEPVAYGLSKLTQDPYLYNEEPINTDGFMGDVASDLAEDAAMVAGVFKGEDLHWSEATDAGVSYMLAVSAFFGKGAPPFVPELLRMLKEIENVNKKEAKQLDSNFETLKLHEAE